MFEFKEIVTYPKLLIELHNAMRSRDLPSIRLQEEETNNKAIKNTKHFFRQKQHPNLESPSNNVKLKSDKTLTTQILLFLNYKADETFFKCDKVTNDKIRNNKAKLKGKSHFLNQITSNVLKTSSF